MTELNALEQFATFQGAPSVAMRIELTRRICDDFNNQTFKDEEKDVAGDILFLLAEDIELNVRTTLAEHIKHSPDIPRSIATKLAKDVKQVAIPILQYSPVLTEEDLVNIIRSTKDASKLLAITKRNKIGSPVSDALVNTENGEVVQWLLKNNSAEIAEESLIKAFTLFKENEAVLKTLVNYGELSSALAERMISIVTDTIRDELAEKYGLSGALSNKISQDVREDALLDATSAPGNKDSAVAMAQHLFLQKELGPSVVLKALCRGELVFFEAGLARLSGIPLENAKKLITDPAGEGFKALYKAAKMPDSMFEATTILLRLAAEISEHTGGKAFARQMVSRIIEEQHQNEVPHMDYMLTLLRTNPEIEAETVN
jgi:uncharacterized protein (DUF2336 family)